VICTGRYQKEKHRRSVHKADKERPLHCVYAEQVVHMQGRASGGIGRPDDDRAAAVRACGASGMVHAGAEHPGALTLSVQPSSTRNSPGLPGSDDLQHSMHPLFQCVLQGEGIGTSSSSIFSETNYHDIPLPHSHGLAQITSLSGCLHQLHGLGGRSPTEVPGVSRAWSLPASGMPATSPDRLRLYLQIGPGPGQASRVGRADNY
jgi:hypothetical protein